LFHTIGIAFATNANAICATAFRAAVPPPTLPWLASAHSPSLSLALIHRANTIASLIIGLIPAARLARKKQTNKLANQERAGKRASIHSAVTLVLCATSILSMFVRLSDRSSSCAATTIATTEYNEQRQATKACLMLQLLRLRKWMKPTPLEG